MQALIWTAEIDAKIKEMRDQLAPWDEVADVIGVDRVKLIAHAKNDLGLPSKVPRRPRVKNHVYR